MQVLDSAYLLHRAKRVHLYFFASVVKLKGIKGMFGSLEWGGSVEAERWILRYDCFVVRGLVFGWKRKIYLI